MVSSSKKSSQFYHWIIIALCIATLVTVSITLSKVIHKNGGDMASWHAPIGEMCRCRVSYDGRPSCHIDPSSTKSCDDCQKGCGFS